MKNKKKSGKDDFIFFLHPNNTYTNTSLVDEIKKFQACTEIDIALIKEEQETKLPISVIETPRLIVKDLIKSEKTDKNINFRIYIPGEKTTNGFKLRSGEFLFPERKKKSNPVLEKAKNDLAILVKVKKN